MYVSHFGHFTFWTFHILDVSPLNISHFGHFKYLENFKKFQWFWKISVKCPKCEISTCEMSKMWDVQNVRYPKCEMSKMWDVQNVKRPKCEMSKMWNAVCETSKVIMSWCEMSRIVFNVYKDFSCQITNGQSSQYENVLEVISVPIKFIHQLGDFLGRVIFSWPQNPHWATRCGFFSVKIGKGSNIAKNATFGYFL